MGADYQAAHGSDASASRLAPVLASRHRREVAIAQFAYANGEYLVAIKPAFVERISAPACARTNDVLEVDLRRQPGVRLVTGVAFDMIGNFEDAHLLIVDQDHQRFELIRFNLDGSATLLIPWSYTVMIGSTGDNHVRVTRNGASIVIDVNVYQIANLADDTIAGPTATGLLAYPVSTSGQATFDNNHVR